MKNCPVCGTQLNDDVAFCASCGSAQPAVGAAPQPQPQPQPVYAAPVDVNDHTGEFDPKDISDHKVYCMLCYLMGVIGIIIALLAGKDSPYTQFHVRTAIKFTVVETLTAIVTALLCWTIIVPIAAAIFLCILFVLQIICFFQICKGKAKDPAIIRSMGFLK